MIHCLTGTSASAQGVCHIRQVTRTKECTCEAPALRSARDLVRFAAHDQRLIGLAGRHDPWSLARWLLLHWGLTTATPTSRGRDLLAQPRGDALPLRTSICYACQGAKSALDWRVYGSATQIE